MNCLRPQWILANRGDDAAEAAHGTTARSAGVGGVAHKPARWAMVLVAVAGIIGSNGCTQVPVWKQERVSKSNMLFSDRGAFVYGPRINAQVEPGAADNGGAAAAGCTACK